MTGESENLSQNQLVELHGKPYVESFKVGAASVMVCYGKWNSTHMHESSFLMTDVLKNQMDFQGWANGDWQAHANDGDVASSVSAGLDVCMPGHVVEIWEAMLPEYKAYFNNNVNNTRANDAVRRVLRQKVLKFHAHNFRNLGVHNDAKNTIGCNDHHTIARVAARKSLVLVKNENNALPISTSANIACVGIPMRHEGIMCGGWTYIWQGYPNQDIDGVTSFYEGLDNGGSGNVTYSANGSNLNGVDVAFVGFGEEYYAEAEFPDLRISPTTPFDGQDNVPSWQEQEDLVRSVASQVETTILVITCGRPINITNIVDDVDAVIIAWWPGSEGGNALADLVYDNEYDFSAKLAYTWPRDVSQVPINYGYPGNGTDAYNGKTPLYEYDYGLNLAGQVLPKGFYTQVSLESL